MDRQHSQFARSILPPHARGSRDESHAVDKQPQPNAIEPDLQSSNTIADNEWQKAREMVTKNPSLMTSSVLIHALQRQAPFHLIQHMLRINPHAASVPKVGPTALQIAVQNFCSTACIEQLLRVCPFALVAKNPGSHLDPLSYAKRFRSAESELIRLLSYPVGYWVQQRSKRQENDAGNDALRSSSTTTPMPQTTGNRPAIELPNVPRKQRKSDNKTQQPQQSPRFFLPYGCGKDTTLSPARDVPLATATESPAADVAGLNAVDPRELDNCKLICMAVLKGHKRLSKDMLQMQKKMQEVVVEAQQGPDMEAVLAAHGSKLWEQVQEQNQKMHRTQMVAIDMKDQAMKSQVNRVEKRVVKALEGYQQESDSRIKGLQGQLQMVTTRMSQMEAQMAEIKKSPKSKLVMKPKPPKRIFVPRGMDESFDTCDETDPSETPLPFVFVTPFSTGKSSDDGRSLLNGSSFGGDRPFRRTSKRLFHHVLCKNPKN